nr:PREDICTED: kyphoscoliosis peptidase isoform X1 [Anolis carolinensis]XP_008103738.1 PREDICTED: kyphoscoliosis peptidase isoform X1 [Anolis carolinensis]XP_008103739.1 PREDICTED: kyphoscoliosis peptidase isoform X1 [Anolis carolinensis]|eukprot:XP_008103737.1 PREDICTED: kyphoscoliosis peptidase isoform X1 [Anolis carolinensis]
MFKYLFDTLIYETQTNSQKLSKMLEKLDQNYQGERCCPGEIVYPCYKPNKKSIPINLNQFKELDTYASKEVNVRDSVENLVKVLVQKAPTDLKKVRAIWMWICHHIEYDVEWLRGNTKTSLDPEGILKSGKTICAGYAKLFETMCCIAGIRCERLTGIAKGKGSGFKNDKRHAWNAVYLDGKWHLLDCTWGSGYVNGDKFTFRHKEFYFLTQPDLFAENHSPDDPKWQLLDPAPATI